ncbi:hypothetical protein HOC35_02770 [Candidatus Woesearchaeota archaeon]|jgi:hypothetical protein|nr:hypothetical protein [Candidatus Woesearchaeota archaeon]
MQSYIVTHIGNYKLGNVLSVVRKEGNPIAIAKIKSYTTTRYDNINMIWRTGEIIYHSRIKKKQMKQLMEEEKRWINYGGPELAYDNNKAGHPIEHQQIINKVLEALKGN